MPAGDLCTLTDVQTYLGDATSQSAGVLGALITQVSAWVQSYCERNLSGILTYNWMTDGHGGDTLPLPEGPVVSILSVSIDGNPVLPSDGQSSGWLADDRSISIIGGQFCAGRKNVLITYTAGYPYVWSVSAITGLPMELQFAVVETVALRFKGRTRIGKNSEGMAGQSTSYDNSMAPKDAMYTLNKYKKNVPW